MAIHRTGWETRLHETTISMPDSRCSADGLARLKAFRRSRTAAQEAEDGAWRAHGRVLYGGADEPPEWVLPDDPE